MSATTLCQLRAGAVSHICVVRISVILLVVAIRDVAAGRRRARRTRIAQRRAIARWKRLDVCYNLVPVSRLRHVAHLRHANFCDLARSCNLGWRRGAAPRKARTHRAAPRGSLSEASRCLLQSIASCVLASCSTLAPTPIHTIARNAGLCTLLSASVN